MFSSFPLSSSRSATSARTERGNAHLLSISRRETTLPMTYGVLVSTLPGNSLEMCGYGRWLGLSLIAPNALGDAAAVYLTSPCSH